MLIASIYNNYEGFARETHYIHLVHSNKLHVLCVTLNAFSDKSDTSGLHSVLDNGVCVQMLFV